MSNTQVWSFIIGQAVMAALYIWWYEARVLRPAMKRHKEFADTPTKRED